MQQQTVGSFATKLWDPLFTDKCVKFYVHCICIQEHFDTVKLFCALSALNKKIGIMNKISMFIHKNEYLKIL